MNNYVKIYCNGTIHVVYTSLSRILDELGEPFLRIHKSYIINKHKITSFNQEQIEIETKQLPIGNKYRAVIEKF